MTSAVCVTELESSNVLRWLVFHNLRLHPHYQPPGRQYVVNAQEVYLRERAFYNMMYDVLRCLAFLAVVLVMVNMRRNHDIFLRNDSVYQQVFTEPQFHNVCTSTCWHLSQSVSREFT